MLTLFDLAIVVVISLAAFFDLAWRRIPNWLILLGLTLALGLNGLRGSSELYQGVVGMSIGVGVLFIPFAFRWVGAGDVKFLGVIGAFVGPYLLPRVLWYTAVLAGLMALFSVVLRRLSIDFLFRAMMDFKRTVLLALTSLTFGATQTDFENGRAVHNQQGVPWGVGISLGTVAAYFLDPLGRWAGF